MSSLVLINILCRAE